MIIIMEYLLSANLQFIPELGALYRNNNNKSFRLEQYKFKKKKETLDDGNNKLIHGQCISRYNLHHTHT